MINEREIAFTAPRKECSDVTSENSVQNLPCYFIETETSIFKVVTSLSNNFSLISQTFTAPSFHSQRIYSYILKGMPMIFVVKGAMTSPS